MYLIGLTGNIATGKTIVLRMLAELGADTLDTDELTHRLMLRGGGSSVYDQVVEMFGRFIVGEDGEINRTRLGNIAFNDPEALEALESIIHPGVIEYVRSFIEYSQEEFGVIEAIKLFESGLADLCESTWVVTSPVEVQVHRLMKNRNLTRTQAMMRIEAQPSPNEKIARADISIDNSGDVVATWNAVQREFNAIKAAVMPARPEPAPVVEIEPEPEVVEMAPVDLDTMEVRRAKRSDLAGMSALYNMNTGEDIDQVTMMERFFSKGFFIAEASEQVIGMAGWRAENLIAGVDDFMIREDGMWLKVGTALLEEVEKAAKELSCEVSLLFLHGSSSPKATAFFEMAGYERREREQLIQVWREAADEYYKDGDILMIKRLLEHRIMKPI